MYLIERHNSRAKSLTETTKVQFALVEAREGRPLRVRGEVGYVDRPTGNGRVYPRPVIEREIRRLQEDLSRRGVLGELDHPDSGRSTLQRASHVVTALELTEDGRIMAEYEVLPTDCGRNLEAILRAECMVGASIRGFGTTVVKEGLDEVQADYRLATFDVVLDPADANAYPTVVRESMDRVNSAEFDIPLEQKLAEAVREGMILGAAEESTRVRAELEDRVVRASVEAAERARAEVIAEMGEFPYAVQAVKAIREAILPFMLPSRYRAEVDAAKAEALATTEKLAESQRALRAMEGQLRENLYGDVIATLPTEALQAKARESLGDLASLPPEVFEEKFLRVKGDLLQEHVATLEAERVALVEHSDRTTTAARHLAVASFIEERLRLHPHAVELRAILESNPPATTEEAARIIAAHRPTPRGSLLESLRRFDGPRGLREDPSPGND